MVRICVPFVVGSLAIIAMSCGEPPKASLQMNMDPADAYRLSVRKDVTITTDGPSGKSDPIPLSNEIALVLRATEVYDTGDVAVSIRVESSQLLFAPNAAFVGSEFSGRMSPQGRIVELFGTQAIRDRIYATLPEDDPNPLLDRDVMIGLLADDVLLSIINPVLEIWPTTSVAPGDEWNRAPIYEPSAKTYEHTQFALDSIEPSDARIEYQSVFRTGPDPDAPQVGAARGEIHLIPSRGILRSSRTEGKFSLPAPDAPEQTTHIDLVVYATFSPV